VEGEGVLSVWAEADKNRVQPMADNNRIFCMLGDLEATKLRDAGESAC
jgi:hypothetical protein